METFHRLLDDDFLAVERNATKAELLGHSRIYQVQFNDHRWLIWKAGETPAQFFADG